MLAAALAETQLEGASSFGSARCANLRDLDAPGNQSPSGPHAKRRKCGNAGFDLGSEVPARH